MGFDINLESETGEILATVSDPQNLLHRIFERAVAEEPRLAEIDWNGDTTFNRLQMPRFLSEWEAMKRHTNSIAEKKIVAEVRELVCCPINNWS